MPKQHNTLYEGKCLKPFLYANLDKTEPIQTVFSNTQALNPDSHVNEIQDVI